MRIFLTGASGGIGKSIHDELVKNGIDVIAPSKSDLNLQGDFDISYPNYPEVDGFIHCAGINIVSQIDELNFDDLEKTYRINTLSFIKLCKQLKLSANSNIIAIGSLYANQTKEGRISYSTSKHALLGAVKTLALEKSTDNIKVNMISPGFVDTELTRKNNTSERINFLEKNIPLGLVNSNEIATLCLYLINHNKSITGQNIIIDGGYSIKGI
jgi:3-oxoacyl-[acyl-carrier protein] reductase